VAVVRIAALAPAARRLQAGANATAAGTAVSIAITAAADAAPALSSALLSRLGAGGANVAALANAAADAAGVLRAAVALTLSGVAVVDAPKVSAAPGAQASGASGASAGGAGAAVGAVAAVALVAGATIFVLRRRRAEAAARLALVAKPVPGVPGEEGEEGAPIGVANPIRHAGAVILAGPATAPSVAAVPVQTRLGDGPQGSLGRHARAARVELPPIAVAEAQSEGDEGEISASDLAVLHPVRTVSRAEALRSASNNSGSAGADIAGGAGDAGAAAEWVRRSDEGGDFWFESVATGEVSWNLPPGAKLVGEPAAGGAAKGEAPLPAHWTRQHDETDTWYSNSLTGEVSWDRPTA